MDYELHLRRDGLLNEITAIQTPHKPPPRKNYKGFCLNCKHEVGQMKYFIEKSKSGRIEAQNKNQVSCRVCQHALYWSSNYKEAP